jgi:phosphatidate phosphatase APP1
MFLTRFDISRRKKRHHRTVEHKVTAIEKTLQSYPDMQFLLMGDSAQHDIEIYNRVIAHYPGRIAAVIIRDVEGRAALTPNAVALANIRSAKIPVYCAPALAEATNFLKREGLGHLLES